MAQKISSLQFLNLYFWGFFDFVWKTLNCHIIETIRDFDLIPTLKLGLSTISAIIWQSCCGGLHVAKLMGLYAAKSWLAALDSFKSNLWVLMVKKVVINQKTRVFHWSLATKLSENAGSPNLSLAPLRNSRIVS